MQGAERIISGPGKSWMLASKITVVKMTQLRLQVFTDVYPKTGREFTLRVWPFPGQVKVNDATR